MTEEFRRFCVRCGANLPEGATFCPKCGSPCDDCERPSVENTGYYNPNRRYSSSPLDSISVFILMYALGAIVYALMYLIMGFTMNSELWGIMEDSTAEVGGLGMTMAQFKSIAIIGGALGLISGICAYVSYINIKRQDNGRLALICCAAASLLSVGLFLELGIVTLLIGLFMTYRIHKNQDCFQR